MNSYISTGKKILRHLDKLKLFQEKKIMKPISLQIAPTSRCNLNCCFCSNVNRNKHEDLSVIDIKYFIASTKPLTVEWTGGGDPTQYEHIKDVILFSHKLNLKQGFITNGIALVDKINDYIKYLDWVRISLNSLDYVDDVLIPVNYKGTLGFSYVINQKTTLETINKVKEYAARYKPKYVRIVPNCQISAEELIEKNKELSEEVNKWGHPFFYQEKVFASPKRCWWGYFKPFLLHDGYIYPCSSVVLNDTADRSFHEKFRWMGMQEFINAGNKPAIPYDCKYCTSCVFGEQNNLVEAIINPEMECFV